MRQEIQKRFSAWSQGYWGTVFYRKPKKRLLKTVAIQWRTKKYGRYEWHKELKAKLLLLMVSTTLLTAFLLLASHQGHILFGGFILAATWPPKPFTETGLFVDSG
jgi:hypothetical protein